MMRDKFSSKKYNYFYLVYRSLQRKPEEQPQQLSEKIGISFGNSFHKYISPPHGNQQKVISFTADLQGGG